MMPVECDIRLFDELGRLLDGPACVVPQAVLAELDSLAAGSGEEAVAADVGSDLADEHCQTREATESYADDAVFELAQADDVTHVVTNDGPLRTRLLDAGIPVISLRGRNKLAITQP
ncbi:twitching motility protein PilT [Halovenus salina]|uniref:twitching motility protein PilT n=1 Tax=Halovenus salina TaxID=1510225 RepID=UPI002260DA29|nr:twitching motility protein PilT [Halovenus salina]